MYGGDSRWSELAEGRASAELVEILIKELDGTGVTGDEYITAKGSGGEVPAFLRWDGQLRNKRVSRRDCAMFIRDVWRDKIDVENSVPLSTLMNSFRVSYLNALFLLY